MNGTAVASTALTMRALRRAVKTGMHNSKSQAGCTGVGMCLPFSADLEYGERKGKAISANQRTTTLESM